MLPALTLGVVAWFVTAAAAEDAAPPDTTPPQQSAPAAATPPPLPQNPLPGSAPAPVAQPNPVPDAGTSAQAACIEETGDYQTQGDKIIYVIGLTNKCDKRLRCEIFAYVVGARGPTYGHTITILAAAANGAAPTLRTFAMKVKAAGGTAQVSRQCRVF